LDAKNSEIKTMRSTMERYNQDMSKLEQQLKEQRVCIAYLFLLILVSSTTLAVDSLFTDKKKQLYVKCRLIW
jgi:hypothetical protein